MYRLRSEGGDLPHDQVVIALFGADLQGFASAPSCALLGELCYDALPGEGEVLPFADARFDVARADLAWVGDALTVGPLTLPFAVDAESGLAWYEAAPVQLAAEPLGVALDGEWGPFEADGLLPIPVPLVLDRDPNAFVALSTTGPTSFGWEPAAGEVYVEVTRPDGHRELHRAEDDGFTYDASPFAPFAEGEIFVFDVFRLDANPVDANGNALTTLAIGHVRLQGGSALPATCLGWLAVEPSARSGTYEVQPDPAVPPVTVWCDMDTDGGGWTLVGSSSAPLDDAASAHHEGLATLSPTAAQPGIWDGLRRIATDPSDLRFACKLDPADPAMAVDLSFYGTGWYREVTTGADADACFNEDDGAGADPPPERRDNLTGEVRAAGDPWDAGVLEGEDSCGALDDFSVDFDDRGIDGNQSDGTDWGEDDGDPKCGTSGAGLAWFVFVREG